LLLRSVRRLRARGSFTVEATLIMTILLPILTALIYTGYYYHDRGVLQAAACEVAACADNLQDTKDLQNKLNQLAVSLTDSRSIAVSSLRRTVSLSDSRVEVTCSGTLSLPGLIAPLFGKSTLSIRETCRRDLTQPTDIIRKARGVEYVMDTLKKRKSTSGDQLVTQRGS